MPSAASRKAHTPAPSWWNGDDSAENVFVASSKSLEKSCSKPVVAERRSLATCSAVRAMWGNCNCITEGSIDGVN